MSHNLALKEDIADMEKIGDNPFIGVVPQKTVRACFDNQLKNTLNSCLYQPGVVNLIVLKIKDILLIREMFGENTVHSLTVELTESINKNFSELWNDLGIRPTIFFPEQGESLVVWSKSGSDESVNLERAFALKTLVRNELNANFIKWTGHELNLDVGYSNYHNLDGKCGERDFFFAVNQARRYLSRKMGLHAMMLARNFHKTLKYGLIDTFYQPIVNMKNGRIHAWEALSRGLASMELRSPITLFDLAEDFGELFILEKICREKAVKNFGDFEEDQKLFLNIHPKTLADPGFTPGETLAILKENGLRAENIVFEITERHSIKGFDLFHQTLNHYRNQGFKVAVDDVASGYSGLSSIAQIRPDYIKIDMSMTRGIDKNPIKQALMETLTTLANRIGSEIIAEGVETQEEANYLFKAQVHYGQGYLFAKPAFPKPLPKVEVPEIITGKDESSVNYSCSVPIRKLTQAALSLSHESMVSEARDMFRNNPDQSGIIVMKGDKPAGLIMNYRLDKQLSTNYGLALYLKKPVTYIMDNTALILSADTPAEQAAKLAINRDHLKSYDDVIVVDEDRLPGIVTVRRLMDTIARIQVEMAKGVNPLTGLPGNVALEKEIASRIEKGNDFDIIYADLDHFKVYNDTYGFGKGDMVIRLAASTLSRAVKRFGTADSMLCHVGGDDFVLLAPVGHSENICRFAVRFFQRTVKYVYNGEDASRGWVRAHGRDGVERDYPLVSISLGILGINGKSTLMEISERAAHIKKYAKSIPGNSYVRDRRTPQVQS